MTSSHPRILKYQYLPQCTFWRREKCLATAWVQILDHLALSLVLQ